MLRNESTYKLPLNRNTYRAIKMQTNTTIDVEQYINDCINEYKDSESGNGLFTSKDGMFWSESFIRRMEKYVNKIKSIYHSDPEEEKTKTKMDEIDKMEFERIIQNCELHVLDPALAIEIKEILKEMYMDLKTKEKVEEMNSKKLLYALKQYSIANTKTVIQKPKEYFKKCILSAIGQTELSTQYDAYTIEMGAV